MALRANTLVNGEWTTTTFNVDHVLRAHNNKPETPDLMDVEKPPILGLLTQTVIRSPLVHWILPARLRGPKIHDVAFIGVRTFDLFSSPLIFGHVHCEFNIVFYLQVRFFTCVLLGAERSFLA